MAIGINSSYSGMNTIRNLSLIQRSLNRTMQRLSSGQEINQASDGPAELTISEQMRSQIGSLTQRIKSLEYNLNKNEAADSAIQELRGKATEIKSLALAAANSGAEDPEAVKAYQQQMDDLVGSYNQQLENAQYGDQKLLDGSAGAVQDLTNLKGISVATPEEVKDAVKRADAVINELNTAQMAVGAKSKGEYDSTIKSLEVASQNMTAAEATIRDTNYANEQATYLKQIVQTNVGLASVAQGNLVSDSVFKLLHA